MARLFFVILGCMCSTMVGAQQRSMAEAQAVAQRFMQQKHLILKATDVAGKRFVATQQPYYLFEAEAEKGVVIVAGDVRMGDVLGYTTKGSLNNAGISAGLQELLDGYAAGYEQVKKGGVRSVRPLMKHEAVAPIIPTRWGQEEPFYNDCPVVGGERCATGCVATTMAQIINCYGKEVKLGGGKLRYVFDYAGRRDSFDFDNTTIDFSVLNFKYGTDATEVQAREVAKLMHACGVSVSMKYAVDGSGTSNFYVPDALTKYFGFNAACKCIFRANYVDSVWYTAIYDELEAKRPIAYSGSWGSLGHSFAIDGCDDQGYFHINWGWNLHEDGYFTLNHLGDYNESQDMVIGISTGEVKLRDIPTGALALDTLILNTKEMNLTKGGMLELFAEEYSARNTYPDVVSQDTNIVSVEIKYGTIFYATQYFAELTAKKVGETDVVFKVGGKTERCHVKVTEGQLVKSIESTVDEYIEVPYYDPYDGSEKTAREYQVMLAANCSKQLEAHADSAASNRTLIWSSSNPDQYAVDQTGKVTCLHEDYHPTGAYKGWYNTPMVRATAADGSGVILNFMILAMRPVEEIVISTKTPLVTSGKWTPLDFYCKVDGQRDETRRQYLKPISSDETILKVVKSGTDFLLHGQNEGVATLTLDSHDGKQVQSSCTVTVAAPTHPYADIKGTYYFRNIGSGKYLAPDDMWCMSLQSKGEPITLVASATYPHVYLLYLEDGGVYIGRYMSIDPKYFEQYHVAQIDNFGVNIYDLGATYALGSGMLPYYIGADAGKLNDRFEAMDGSNTQWLLQTEEEYYTSIATMTMHQESRTCYNLQGQPLKTLPQHGIFIQNGRKMIK